MPEDTEPLVEEKIPCCSTNPRSTAYKVVGCCFLCLLSFGSYFCYDNPAALHSQFTDPNVMGLTESQYMGLYAWYSWPNVVLSFVGGYLIDKVLGVRLGAGIFSLFVICGQFVFAAGVFSDLLWLCYVGRFIFGIGGESLAVAQNTYTCRWFSGSTLNLVFGLQLSMARIGSTVNMNVMVPLYNKCMDFMTFGNRTLGMALLIAASTCVFSFICTAVIAAMDRNAEKQGAIEAKISLMDVFKFPAQFWLVTIICVLFYASVFPFVAIALPYYQSVFGLSPTEAAALNSIIYIMSAPLAPTFGLIIDIVGFNASWVFLANVIVLTCHLLLGYVTSLTPWVGVVGIGIGYSMLASSLWPMVSLLVQKHQIGTAYGFMQSWQNLGLALVSIAIGAIAKNQIWKQIEGFFFACVAVSAAAALALIIVDRVKKGKCNVNKIKMRRLEREAADQDLLDGEDNPAYED
ncbi:unnamed protein product [Oikopleura dioica]|uniref:Lysosomal dipeptide transporter MFSD1 n=1 Tax=Oikopleura dioica TaxID=34765 RepID=E4XDK3_OIKDI|nr:unnamed protein product [Oikopleura dioica]